MNNVLGIINVTQENKALNELIAHRCQAAIPYGGRYRMVDFILSSMVHSKIRNIAIYTPQNNRSIQDHLGSGKDWDLEYKQDGLFVFPKNMNTVSNTYGDLCVLHQNLDYLEKSSQEYVLISFGCSIINIDFREVIKQHINSDANVTVVYKEKDPYDKSFTNISFDDFQNVKRFDEAESPYGSLDIFVIDKNKLVEFIKTFMHPYRNLLDVLKHCDFSWKIKGYEYDGYVHRINSINDYYQANMELLNPTFLTKLLTEPNEIYTKLIDEPPATYNPSAVISNSIVANGCIIEGTVKNSILFRGVHVKRGATVENSIIMENAQIGNGASIEGTIIEKEVAIQPYTSITRRTSTPRLITKQKCIGEGINTSFSY